MALKVISVAYSKDKIEGDNKTITITKPYNIPDMGTSGLRCKQGILNQPHFFEQAIQGIADYFKTVAEKLNCKTILVGGDPRLGLDTRCETAAKILAANGFKVITSTDNIISTPGMSMIIKKFNEKEVKIIGAITLTASHNPFTDSGFKVNNEKAEPVLEDVTNTIRKLQNQRKDYQISNLSLTQLKEKGALKEIDAVKVYADALDKHFNFAEMRQMLAKHPMKLAIDGMSGAAGSYIKEVFLNRLSLEEGKHIEFIGEEPHRYLGGLLNNGEPKHPEPDFSFIPKLIRLNNTKNFDLVAAYDSDVDRRLNGGKGFWLESADEFALVNLFLNPKELINQFEENRKKNPTLKEKTIYIARSLVTSNAPDLIMKALVAKYKKFGYEIKFCETPTGWKFIGPNGNWGVEESNGMGNPLIAEKDGIFSTLTMMKIMLKTGKTVPQLQEKMWKDFGRAYFTRGEVSGPKTEEMQTITNVLDNAKSMIGQKFGKLTLESVEKPKLKDPIKETELDPKTWVLKLSDGNLIKARFSGTGSGGYCLRVYVFKYDKNYKIEKTEMVQNAMDAFDELLKKGGFSGKSKHWIHASQPDPYKQK